MENSEKEPLIVNRVPERDTNEKGTQGPPVTRPILMSIITTLFNCSLMVTNMTVNQYVYKWLGENYGNTSSTDNATIICTNNGSSRENEIQKLASKWIWYLSLVEYGLPIIFVLTLGVYSDFIGRKPVMLISLIGNSIMNGVFALFIFLNLNLIYFLIAFAIGALAGSRYSFHIGYLGSVADTTGQNKDRSFKIAILDILMAIGSSSGQIITGYVISYAGYMYPVIISCGFCFIGAILVLMFIPETLKRRNNVKISFRSGWRNLTGFYWNKDTIKGNKNWLFGISLLSFTIYFAPLVSRIPIETLFQLRSPFCFTSDLIGWFQFTKECLHSIFGMLLVKLFHRCMNDVTIAFIGCFTGSAYFIVMGFSKTEWMMYLGEYSDTFT